MLTETGIDPNTAMRVQNSWRRHGYATSYRHGETNHCPGCGRHNWIIGRLMAECAFCETALTLTEVHGYGSTQRICRHGVTDAPFAPDFRAVA